MHLSTVVLVILIVMLVASLPSWPYSRRWGYLPSGLLALVSLAVAALAVSGRL